MDIDESAKIVWNEDTDVVIRVEFVRNDWFSCHSIDRSRCFWMFCSFYFCSGMGNDEKWCLSISLWINLNGLINQIICVMLID